MTMFMRLLRASAQKHGLCILVGVPSFPSTLFPTTHLFGIARDQYCIDEGRDRSQQVLNDATAAGRPALGASFTFMTDVTLWLERAPGQDRELRTAEVLRSRISVRRRFPFPPLFLTLRDGIDDDVLLRDVEGALCVSNTARKGTGRLS
jgi:hypothetical protein